MTDLSSSNRPELTELSVACRHLGAINVATDTQDEYNARWSRANLALTAAESLFFRLQSENERLKETALTGHEQEMVIYALENSVSLYPEASPWPPIIKKLRSGTS